MGDEGEEGTLAGGRTVFDYTEVKTYEIYSKSSQLKRTSSVFCENSHKSESILMVKGAEMQ
jgi:hypothetical protein